MLLEIAAFFGLILLILFAYAELSYRKVIGVIAALLLIVYGIWIAVDDIQIKTGDVTTGNTIVSTYKTGNASEFTINNIICANGSVWNGSGCV